MTLDEFRSQYRLLKRVTQRGIASYHAVNASGRVVMVHSLDSGLRDEVHHVRALLPRLAPPDRAKILAIYDVDSAPIVVTEFLQGFETLAQWLEVRTQGVPFAPATPPGGPAPGEFTQLFGPNELPKAPVLESLPVDTDEPLERPAPSAPGPNDPGEFTRLLGATGELQGEMPQSPAPAADPPEAAPPSVPALTTAPPKGAGPPGEFTQLFGPGAGAPVAPPAEPPPAPKPPLTQPERSKPIVRWRDGPPAEPTPPPAPKPLIRWKQAGPSKEAESEFTRLFGPREGGPIAPASDAAQVEPQFTEAPAPEPPSPAPHMPPAAANPPGGFTQLLRAAAELPGEPASPLGRRDGFPPPPAGPPALGSAPPGEFTRLMSGLPSPAAPGPGLPAQPAPLGPSEFTRILSGVPGPAAPPAPGGAPSRMAPPPTEPPAEESPRPSPVMVVVALGAILVLAAALILFFALK
jgi:hypothetical protein